MSALEFARTFFPDANGSVVAFVSTGSATQQHEKSAAQREVTVIIKEDMPTKEPAGV